MLIIFYLVPSVAAQFLASLDCYGVMFDAGSSGTRVYVYKWPCRQTQSMSLIDIQQIAPQQKVNPGLSTYVGKVEQIHEYLAPLITFAQSQVPLSMWPYTPIMLGATAGMRLLDESDQKIIINQVRAIFQQSGFLFVDPNWARIITGQEEGSYMWLSVNFLLGNLKSEIPPLTALTIDLGGASTQIAEMAEFPTDTSTLTIPNLNTYDLFSVTFLGYGNDQARITVVSNEIVEGSDVINSPCYHNGYSDTWSDNKKYKINGLGKLVDCQAQIHSFLDFVNKYPQPQLGTLVYAVNGVSTIASLFGMSEFKLPELYQKISTFTSLTKAEVEIQYPDNPYIWTNFFMSIYVYELLAYGYKLPNDIIIQSPQLINQNTPSWTLAATFYQIALLDCKFDSPICINLFNQI